MEVIWITSGGHLDYIWGDLGPLSNTFVSLWRHIGATLRHFSITLEHFGVTWGSLWDTWEPRWSTLEPLWGHFGVSLGLYWDDFGTHWGHFGSTLSTRVSLACHFGPMSENPVFPIDFNDFIDSSGHFGIDFG